MQPHAQGRRIESLQPLCTQGSEQPGQHVTEAGTRLGTIPGVVPSLIGGIEGCAFRSRCAYARAECSESLPIRRSSATHRYVCVEEFAEVAEFREATA